MSRIVLDASVGLALVLPEPATEAVLEQVAEWRAAGTRLLVPSLFWLEVANVLVRAKRFDGSRVLEALYELEAIDLGSIELDRPTLLLALDIMERHGLSSYDAAYLALAESLDAKLATLDAELGAAAGTRAVRLPGGKGVSESVSRYGPRPSWAHWPGASAYLAELRARVIART